MLRDRCSGPILFIPLLLAIGCGGSSGGPPTGSAGTTGGAGRGGRGGGAGSSAGATGTAGSGGAAGRAGSGGAAGTAGSGAATGSGGATGTAGSGGATGTAGSSGNAGAAGHAGSSAAGTGGTGGSFGGAGGAAAAGSGGAAGTAGGGGSAGTGGGSAGSGGSAAAGSGGAGGSAETRLDPTPGSYRLICDGSMAVMVDATHFLDGNDEQQVMRLYARGTTGSPLATIDVSTSIGLSTSGEADLEDAARVGNRIFVIASHARNKSGRLERARFRFFAMDLGGTSPGITLGVPGYTTLLLDQMLVAANWATPDAAVIEALTASSNLGQASDPNLSPIVAGTNIEGLAWLPTAARPNQLLIGFRNPAPGGRALIVSLLNADAVVTGAVAQFGEATLLDLAGLSIRGMTWSAAHHAILLIAGPQTEAAGPYKLFKWSGVATDLPAEVNDISGVPTSSAPEAIVTYPNTRDVQIVFDEGDRDIGGGICKDAPEASRLFGDLITYVP